MVWRSLADGMATHLDRLVQIRPFSDQLKTRQQRVCLVRQATTQVGVTGSRPGHRLAREIDALDQVDLLAQTARACGEGGTKARERGRPQRVILSHESHDIPEDVNGGVQRRQRVPRLVFFHQATRLPDPPVGTVHLTSSSNPGSNVAAVRILNARAGPTAGSNWTL